MAMWRFLTPYLVVDLAIVAAASTAYLRGAPAWVVHLGVLIGVLAVLPGYFRWEDRHE
jgi:hypothetical protein